MLKSKEPVIINCYGKQYKVTVIINHFSENNLIALTGECEDGEMFDVFSVNLGSTYGENMTVIKHYYEDLHSAGIVKEAECIIPYGIFDSKAYLCEVNMDAFEDDNDE